MEQKKGLSTAEPAQEAELLDFVLEPGPRELYPTGTPYLPRRPSQSTPQFDMASQTSLSCADRATSPEDCSRQRFIVWAAVKRNRSVYIAPSERLRCPILRCGEPFADHESMLQHLVKCQYFFTGEYMCHDCGRVEKFNNDKHCRCCLGHPTKRRRIINMAKNFFSNIGHKSRKDGPRSVDPYEDDPGLPPPYESLQMPAQPSVDQPQPHIELNGSEILELDSQPRMPPAQLDSVNYEPLATPNPDMFSVFDPVPNNTFGPASTSLTPCDDNLPNGDGDFPMLPPNQTRQSLGSSRPSLALDTHVDRYRNVARTQYLSPSSSLRSTKSSQGISPITPWSASSGHTGIWTTASSIETALTSPASPSSPSGYQAVQQAEYAFVDPKCTESCPNPPDMFPELPELAGDNPCITSAIPRGLSDPTLFPLDPKDNYSWISSVDTTLSLGTSVNMVFTDPAPDLDAAQTNLLTSSPSTRTLVESAWNAFQEHVSSSLLKVALIPENPLANRLREETTLNIFRKGLSILGGSLLEGRNPEDPFDYICFIHVVYAFSLVLHEEDLMARSDGLFRQALAYGDLLSPAYSEIYLQVVKMIWQSTSEDLSTDYSRRWSSVKGKEPERSSILRTATGANLLIVVGQNFLDDVESTVVNSSEQESIGDEASALRSAHTAHLPYSEPLAISACYIAQALGQRFPDSEQLLSSLNAICRRVKSNAISTIRRLELGLLQAGKNSLSPANFFDIYIPQVRELCDGVYSQPNLTKRARYHMLGLSLVESLVQSLTSEPSQPRGSGTAAALTVDGPDPLDEFLESLPQTFENPNYMEGGFLGPIPMGSSHSNATSRPSADSTIDPTRLHHVDASSRTVPVSPVPSPSHSAPPTVPYPSNSMPASPAPPATLPQATPSSHPSEVAAAAVSAATAKRGGSVPSTGGGAPGFGPTGATATTSSSSASASASKVEAHDCCEVCGYRPKGDPQWFKGSMAKHKKLQHSTSPPMIYKCPYPGCASAYKNRPDNLRQHQLEKNHFVGGSSSGGGGGGEVATTRRPSKKRKTTEES